VYIYSPVSLLLYCTAWTRTAVDGCATESVRHEHGIHRRQHLHIDAVRHSRDSIALSRYRLQIIRAYPIYQHLHCSYNTLCRSTVTQLLEILDKWTDWLESGCRIDVIYTDLDKAFDKVIHKLLILK